MENWLQMKRLGSISHKITFSSFLLVVFLFLTVSFPQTRYNMIVSNVEMFGDGIIEFDVSIKSLQDTFILTSYQCSFEFNEEIKNEDRLSLTFIENTSQMTNLPLLAVGINELDRNLKLTFASLPGSDTITKSVVRIGRFRFQNKKSFAGAEPNITWNFDGFVTTILTGESFQNITNQAFHSYDFDGQPNIKLGKNSQITEIPNEYKLFQNYPNPFNPAAKITFNLPKDSWVNLTVYSLLGQEIEVLVNNRIDAGIHSVDFNGGGLSSGIYICKFKVGNEYVETIKMILLR